MTDAAMSPEYAALHGPALFVVLAPSGKHYWPPLPLYEAWDDMIDRSGGAPDDWTVMPLGRWMRSRTAREANGSHQAAH